MANQRERVEHGYQDPRDQRDRENGRTDRGNTDYRQPSDLPRNTEAGETTTRRGQSGAQAGNLNNNQAWTGQAAQGGSEGNWGEMDRGGRSRGPHAGKGPQGFQRSDERIRELVHEALSDDGHLDATHLIVDVKEGEVTLTGKVEDREAKRRAEQIVERVSGVKDVHNTIRLATLDKPPTEKLRH